MTRLLRSTIAMAILAALFSLTGCVTAPSQADYESTVKKLGYGQALPPDWQERVKAFMELRLKDSASAQWQFEGEPFTSWAAASDRAGARVSAGHVVTALLNAKNSFGAYAGVDRYRFILRDGLVIAFQHGEGRWQHMQPTDLVN